VPWPFSLFSTFLDADVCCVLFTSCPTITCSGGQGLFFWKSFLPSSPFFFLVTTFFFWQASKTPLGLLVSPPLKISPPQYSSPPFPSYPLDAPLLVRTSTRNCFFFPKRLQYTPCLQRPSLFCLAEIAKYFSFFSLFFLLFFDVLFFARLSTFSRDFTLFAHLSQFRFFFLLTHIELCLSFSFPLTPHSGSVFNSVSYSFRCFPLPPFPYGSSDNVNYFFQPFLVECPPPQSMSFLMPPFSPGHWLRGVPLLTFSPLSA